METKAPASPNPGLARVSHKAFRMIVSHSLMRMVRCNAGYFCDLT